MNSIEQKMRLHQLPDSVITTFLYYYKQLKDGNTGFIDENEIEAVTREELPDYNSLGEDELDIEHDLKKTVIIKLNGGLGTTMGLKDAKSLIPVKNSLTFLDITALQTLSLHEKYAIKVPLILMNSFRTEESANELIRKYPQLKAVVPYSFLQHKYPKILVDNYSPATFPENPDLEWNPSGHGEVYTALFTSGTLDHLIKNGYEYAFVSNIDNLGATLDIKIMHHMVSGKYPFLMEVADRTWMDKKGGHLARLRSNNKLTLRESGQCSPADGEHFSDINKHSFFNTNNLWLHLPSLKMILQRKNGHLELPLIRNQKKLNPVDENTPDVFQVETAMGSALSAFENASVIRVPRTRFLPVKNCSELLLLRSDKFTLDEYYHLHKASRTDHYTTISLDSQYYSWIDQLNERFPFGAPSLRDCESLTIKGDVTFGKNCIIKGKVTITCSFGERVQIPDNTIISTQINY